jgi:hypothetical protein
LEEIWRHGSSAIRPPTPDASPDGSVTYNPVLKPSPFPYASPIYSNPSQRCSPMNISSVSAPERMPYVLPMPVPSTGRQRSATWSRENVPIASLLTEDKNPRDQ